MAAAICIPTLDPKGFQFPSSHLNVQSGEAGSVSTPHTRPCGSEQADINKGSQAPFPDWSGTCWLQGPVSGLASHPCWVRVYTVYLASRPDFLLGCRFFEGRAGGQSLSTIQLTFFRCQAWVCGLCLSSQDLGGGGQQISSLKSSLTVL